MPAVTFVQKPKKLFFDIRTPPVNASLSSRTAFIEFSFSAFVSAPVRSASDDFILELRPVCSLEVVRYIKVGHVAGIRSKCMISRRK